MPLRDHFRPPIDDLTSWEGFHGQWPAMIVQELARKLPRRYFAAPRVHSGSSVEIDVAAYEKEQDDSSSLNTGNGEGGVATAVWAPARPTLTLVTDFPAQDEYEVRVYDSKRGRRLVAAALPRRCLVGQRGAAARPGGVPAPCPGFPVDARRSPGVPAVTPRSMRYTVLRQAFETASPRRLEGTTARRTRSGIPSFGRGDTSFWSSSQRKAGIQVWVPRWRQSARTWIQLSLG